MKIEDKVTSLELSKQLEEAGAKQESEKWWVTYEDDNGENRHLVDKGEAENWEHGSIYAAFDCAELLARLPLSTLTKTEIGYRAAYAKRGRLNFTVDVDIFGHNDNPAEALGKLKLWRLKEGHCDE